MPRRRHVFAAFLAPVVAAVVAALGLTGAAAAKPGVSPRPAAVVALGDSAASGEGAGGYLPGTRGEGGDWCHRSAAAYVQHTGLAATPVNLACSGANAAAVRFGTGTHYTEGSQAAQLADVARRYRVTAVTLQVGANDDPALTATGIACIRTFLDPTIGPCRDTIGPHWQQRLAAMAPKVEAAVGDVRAAMRHAGYPDDSYAFVLLSYASPVTERMGPLHGVQGCPYSRADAEWGRTVAFAQLSQALAGVAERTGVRFLDLSRATEGREACSHPDPADEWQRRITVDPQALVHGRLDAVGLHLFQESFHPNAAGHSQIGGCLGEFVGTGAGTGACQVGADGNLHAHLPALAPAAH
ncbi:GDSL-type esterase/lipase family protein [Pseudonocardia hispaniensis]|uniref:GDSL-type esterase/lipase family protein n=1 Tax=Pseudonocardia hispaniensis TaxID=904933 RepID=A0ABW1J1I7_9PSEU